MGILTSMFTAVTGLSSYGNAMGVIGNNIANVGTAGFKSSRATFSDLISSSMAGGAGSDQIGLGVYLNDVQTNFSQGSMTTTGNTFDLAIDGIEAVEMAHRAGYTSIMSHRSGETVDNTIADLAVADADDEVAAVAGHHRLELPGGLVGPLVDYGIAGGGGADAVRGGRADLGVHALQP